MLRQKPVCAAAARSSPWQKLLLQTAGEIAQHAVDERTGLADMFSRKTTRNFTKGVRIDLDDNQVTADITIVVEYGSPVPDVARGIQENVKKAIETMTGLTVRSVDVHVSGISFEREQRAAKELDEQQKKLLEQSEESAKEEVSNEAQPEQPAEEVAPEADEIEDEEEPEEDDDVLLDGESEEPV